MDVCQASDFDQPFQVDRMILHLELAGVFDEIRGVVFGQFHECISKDKADGTIDQVIDEWSTKIKVPCIRDFPYGHKDHRCILPIGQEITLDADEGKIIIG